MTEPRSWLFVPADSEKKIAKALAGDADAIILDLEDSVAEANKPAARDLVVETLRDAAPSAQQRWVRVNPLGGGGAEADLAVVIAARPDGIVLPKSENGEDVRTLARLLEIHEGVERVDPGIRIAAIVTETPKSLFGLDRYAGASPRLAAMTWGAEDLSAALGASSKFDASGELSFTYKLARSLCLAGAVMAGVQPVDSLYADFRDEDGLKADCEAGRREGFTGKLAIHPAQVPVINAAFTPSDAEVAHAREIVALFAAHPDAGTIGLDGKMLDRPHLVQAQRVLARAEKG
ncbi:HpcH/HpaI aldolase/citrate lyase family protein [Parasphingopyxis marina]|uniref:CoA ester lyase n=1 Tax=Parasphingopyxis marina TaxID=2761622 RepID=A0A842HVB1_9SPHN|nr:CoA ester lyase [Parasphingopyxis marina]MBC2776321.1 CoA ester lyase [Parasphingopyxis marina]